MKISKTFRPILLAGFAALPATAQTVTFNGDAIFSLPITVDSPPACLFAQTNADNPLKTAVVFTGPASDRGVNVKAGDILYDYADQAVFLVQGKRTTILKTVNAAKYASAISSLTATPPNLLERCLKAKKAELG